LNDYFTLYGPAIEVIENIIIHNRWGVLMYEASNIPAGAVNLGWDGTYKNVPQEIGVYIFYADVVFIDGVRQRVKGNVTLVR